MSANPSSSLSKRSRADAADNQAPHTDANRIKRRQFSRSAAPKASQQEGGAINEEIVPSGKVPRACWSPSQPVAGQYSDLQPIFAPDEEYLFLAVESAIHVYSVAPSRLIHTLHIGARQGIIGYKLCSINQDHLYVFTSSGSISKWEWASGKRISTLDSDRKITSIDACFDIRESSNAPATFYSVCERKDGKRELRVLRPSGEKLSEAVVLETSVNISHIKVEQWSRTIVAYGGHHVLIGTTNYPGCDDANYTWRETTLPVSITSLDVRRGAQRVLLQDQIGERTPEELDLIVGELGGSILVYEDILGFLNNEGNREGGKNPAPRRLHWHRGPVNALCWSRDGNYIISGGVESVMVLWQLDTGRKQFLPHLSSPICNIVVSPSGNSYAVKLADNCIIVLSARELRPYATIIGLQLFAPTAKPKDQFAPNDSYNTTPAVLHPQYPNQLLVTVPASREIFQNGQCLTNSSILQTYDILTDSHISRQALARTNTTVLKTSPGGSEIIPPDIRCLDISQDGSFMATVDSWCPYIQDVRALDFSDTGNHRTKYGETFLKFWKWNYTTNLWELVTRIDRPHSSENAPASVLSLASRPRTNEFVTIGEDAALRVWCPNPRSRGGLKSGPDELESWKCRDVVDLRGSLGFRQTGLLKAALLAYSEDGSALCVCLPSESTANPGVVLLVDAQKCTIHYSRVGVYSGDPCAVKFLGRHVIIVSKRSVSVWDTVDDLVRLPVSTLVGKSQRLLAVSPRTHTFAIATQGLQYHSDGPVKKSRGTQSHVQVYDIESLSSIFWLSLEKCPVAMLSDPFSGDYVVVDTAANVQRFGCSDKASRTTVRSPELSTRFANGLVDLFGAHSSAVQVQPSSTSTPDSDKSSLGSGTLSGVFSEAPSFVLPPASVLFRNVVQSLATKYA